MNSEQYKEIVIEDYETEIRDDKHLMCAEGSCDTKPTETDIENYLQSKGYSGSEYKITYDGFQLPYRWTCLITKK